MHDIIIKNYSSIYLNGHDFKDGFAEGFTYNLYNSNSSGLLLFIFTKSPPISNGTNIVNQSILYRLEFQADDNDFDRYQTEVQHMIGSLKFIN